MNPIPFAQLATYVDKQPIPCVEGVLSTLYPVDHVKKDGTPIQYPKQNGVLKDGAMEHRITFDAKCEQPMEMKGKRVRISSNVGQHGMTGIKMDRYNEQYPKISVTSSAHVEVVGSAGQPAPVQQAAKPAPSQSQQGCSKPAEPEPSGDTAEVRIANWFRVFNLVCQSAGHDPSEVVKGLSPSDLKEITTGTVMSFKGPYATYQAPFFGGQGVGEMIARQDSLLDRAKAVTSSLDSPTTTSPSEPVRTWRDVEYKGVKLGDYEDERIAELISWAHNTPSPKSDEGRALRSALLMADAELSVRASKAVSAGIAKAGLGADFDEEDVDTVCINNFDTVFKDLNYAELQALGTGLHGFTVNFKEAYAKRTASPPSVAKVRKPAPEDDDMPS